MRMAFGLPFTLVGARRVVSQVRALARLRAQVRSWPPPCASAVLTAPRASAVLTERASGAKETRRYGFGLGRFMSIEIKMPALSPTMEEGTLAKWLVKEGDTVKSGDLMAEIETDKATMEFEAIDEGTVSKIMIPEGSEGVKVGTVIALIAGEDEEAAP